MESSGKIITPNEPINPKELEQSLNDAEILGYLRENLKEGYDKYCTYISTLNPSELSSVVLEKIKDDLIMFYKTKDYERFGFDSLSHSCIFWGIVLMSNSLINHTSTMAIISFLSMTIGLSFAGITLKDYFKFKKEKKDELERIKSTLTIINSLSLLAESKEVIRENKKPEEKAEELIKDIGKDNLLERISYIESLIIMLPKEEEAFYKAKLKAVIEAYHYREELNKSSEISLELNNKLYHLYIINQELDAMERELTNRDKIVTKEEYESEINHTINEYLANIASFSDKEEALFELMNRLNKIINPSDLASTLNITNAFASCFWETIRLCDNLTQNKIVSFILPIFEDRIIVMGEAYLDELEQNIDIIASRYNLKSLKETCTKEEYLKNLIQALMEHKYTQNRTLALANN